MTSPYIQNLPKSVIEKLGSYVYLLLDPRTNKVFYVGKGTGNRVLSHIYTAGFGEDLSEKLDKIREIHDEGLEVQHIILRHGLTAKEALEVEAALIDYIELDMLSNQVRGHHSYDRGRMSLDYIIGEYAARKIDIVEPAILITVNRHYQHDMSAEDLYEITRGRWVVGNRRNKAEYAFTVYHGIVRAVYKIEAWHLAMARSTDQKTQQRWEFDGKLAHDKQESYLYGSVAHYLKLGAQNPIKYINCE